MGAAEHEDEKAAKCPMLVEEEGESWEGIAVQERGLP